MITLNASGSSVTFTFDGNSTYLNDGTITVPKNSLALIIDESDMATFRKAASNDIFVSANIAEFGMTKAELESWYKANMVGSTGGGGGVTPEEVEEMIDEAVSGKQDTLIAGENITISGNVISASDGAVDGTSLFGGTHRTSEGTSIRYFSQMLEGQKPSALKFVVANGNNTYSSAITITLHDTEHYNDHYNTLTISSSGGAVTSITEANGGSFTGITVDDDWVLRPAEGYVFGSYQWLINNYGLGLRILPKDGIIESGSTTDVIENGIYKQLQRHEENIGNLALSAVTSTKLSFKDESGITLSTNASSTALAVDDSLKYVGKLGVYVTGDTYTTNLNSESATTYLMLDGIKNVDMWLNQSYTGTPSGWFTISVLNLDGSYDWYLYENDAFTLAGGYAGSTLNYDSSTGKVTITCPSGISSINNHFNFAPADDLTNADCFIGLVSYTSNEYTIQDMIDSIGGGTDAPISAGTGTNSVKENYVNNVASGSYSHAEGRGTSASGDSSHAEGNGTSAKGNYAHAEGHSTVASGDSSHAEGTSTKANNAAAHAEGRSTTASGKYAHTEGILTVASGQSAHAEGNSTRANGSNSHAEGDNTIANNESEHASGEYNVSNTGESTSAQTLFSVGNGGWDETAQDVVRHNAFEIRKNGDIYITSGGTDIKLQDQLGGGGGGGISSAECQTLIDQSISGKADSDDVYTTGQTSGATELATAFAATQPKLSAGTGISIDANNVISATGGGGGGITSGEVQTMIDESISGKVDSTSIVTAVTSASTDSEIPTAKAVFDAIPSGGGGSTYTAGTGIDITNDVISVKMSVGEPSGYPYYSSLNPNASGTTTSERFLYNILGGGYKPSFDFNNARNNQTSKVGYIFYDKTSTTTVSGHTGYGVLIRIYEYNSTNQLYYSNAIIDWKNKEIFFYNKSSASFDTSIVKTIWDYYGKNSLLLYTEPLWDDEGMGGQYALDVSNQSGWDGAILMYFNRSDSKCGAYKFYQNGDNYSLSKTVYNYAKLTENNFLMINDVNAALGGLKLQQISQADYDALVSGGTVDSSTLYVII